MASTYGWSDVRRDLVAGLTVAAIAVPQAMAYALIAGIDPRFGLYSAIVVTAIASIFGSSSHLINGPTNAISLVVFSALAFTGPDKGMAVEATFLLAAMVGIIQILIAVFKLGDLTRYISESVVLGFMAGAGFLVGLTQTGQPLRLARPGQRSSAHPLSSLVDAHRRRSGELPLAGHRTGNRAAGGGLAKGISRKYRLPRVDMLLALAAAAVAAAGWAGPIRRPRPRGGGRVGKGARRFARAAHSADQARVDRRDGRQRLAIACLGLLEALAIAKSISQQTRQPLDYNRQCLAEGLANLGGGSSSACRARGR